MKTLFFPFVALLASCGPCPSFLRGVESGLRVIGPEYRAYLEADSELDDRSKKIRLRTLEELERLLEEVKK